MPVIEVRLFQVSGLLLLLRFIARLERYFWTQAQRDWDAESDRG